MPARLTGRCHCGALRLELVTAAPLAPRACQCGFCRRHGARTVTDPQGTAHLLLGREARRYRFATRSSDYILCGRCGVYLGAVAGIGGALYATLNLNAFDDPRLDLAVVPVFYEGETLSEKRARRKSRWTPAAVQEAGGVSSA
jgi:hypothetical protein